MIPTTDIELENITLVEQPTLTYALDAETGRIRGTIDGLEAIKQCIRLILNTERYKYLAYSWNYGIELESLIGQNNSYVIPELKRYIEEALTQDDRITSVEDFTFTSNGSALTAEFTVNTTIGDIETEVTV